MWFCWKWIDGLSYIRTWNDWQYTEQMALVFIMFWHSTMMEGISYKEFREMSYHTISNVVLGCVSDFKLALITYRAYIAFYLFFSHFGNLAICPLHFSIVFYHPNWFKCGFKIRLSCGDVHFIKACHIFTDYCDWKFHFEHWNRNVWWIQIMNCCTWCIFFFGSKIVTWLKLCLLFTWCDWRLLASIIEIRWHFWTILCLFKNIIILPKCLCFFFKRLKAYPPSILLVLNIYDIWSA